MGGTNFYIRGKNRFVGSLSVVLVQTIVKGIIYR